MYFKHCEKLKKLSKIAKKCRLPINILKQSKMTLWCLKLKYRNLKHTNRINSLNGWTSYQQAPPVTLL